MVAERADVHTMTVNDSMRPVNVREMSTNTHVLRFEKGQIRVLRRETVAHIWRWWRSVLVHGRMVAAVETVRVDTELLHSVMVNEHRVNGRGAVEGTQY